MAWLRIGKNEELWDGKSEELGDGKSEELGDRKSGEIEGSDCSQSGLFCLHKSMIYDLF